MASKNGAAKAKEIRDVVVADDDIVFDTADDYAEITAPVVHVKGRTHDGGEFEETFRCLPELPGGQLLNVVLSADGGIVLQTRAALAFVESAIVPEDEERWTELVFDKRRIVPAATVARIAHHLIERYIGLPTLPSGT
jgi:hypothetical protein